MRIRKGDVLLRLVFAREVGRLMVVAGRWDSWLLCDYGEPFSHCVVFPEQLGKSVFKIGSLGGDSKSKVGD
jgi:hypothetical protein